MSALVALLPPSFEPARTTDPAWSISELEVGSPLNAGTPIVWRPANDGPASTIGAQGHSQGDPYLRLIPLIKPPSNLPRGGMQISKDKLGASRTGAGKPLTGV